MIIKNILVYTENKTFVAGTIKTNKDRILEISYDQKSYSQKISLDQEITYDQKISSEYSAEEVIDGQGAYAIPGLTDLHFHGCNGADFCDGTYESLATIAKYELSCGVTTIAPATMTLPLTQLENILRSAAAYKKIPQNDADLVGINMEGPFISSLKKGAQNAAYILPCNIDIAKRFLDVSEGLIKLIGFAPEESTHADDFIRYMKDDVHISLAHTNADYDTAMAAFQAGADHVVHLYNAMPLFTHRNPGVVGAAYDSPDVTVELICDGIHIHPSVIRATYQIFGAQRIIFISDSTRATGLSDGRYTLGGQDIDVVGNRAILTGSNTIAGSVTNLMDCMRYAVHQVGIPLEDAVQCAAVNPAKKLGIYDHYGSISVGKKANIILLDDSLNLNAVIKDGKQIEA